MNIIENNKLIAEFMGYIDNGCSEKGFLIHPDTNHDIEIEALNYHSDWNELMPVIEKILDVSLNLDSMEMYYDITDCIPSITQTYIAVKDFIVWYNQQI